MDYSDPTGEGPQQQQQQHAQPQQGIGVERFPLASAPSSARRWSLPR